MLAATPVYFPSSKDLIYFWTTFWEPFSQTIGRSTESVEMKDFLNKKARFLDIFGHQCQKKLQNKRSTISSTKKEEDAVLTDVFKDIFILKKIYFVKKKVMVIINLSI